LTATLIRVAVTVLSVRVPVTATVVPTGICVALIGAFFVPNVVCGVISTVTVAPERFRSVQVDPDSLTTLPRTPCPGPR
jgi:hypothetical protein